MFKFACIFCTIAIWVSIKDGTTICNCLNPIYVDKPTDISQCLPISKNYYLNIIRQNYDLQYKQILCNHEKCTEGIWSNYKNVAQQMNNATNDIVNAFFDSKQCNSTSAVKKAFSSYKHVKTNFNAYGRRGFREFSTKCNKVIQNIRQLSYAVGDNVKNAMLACSNLKTQNCDSFASRSDFSKPNSNASECNCLHMSYPPVPAGKEECFSKSFGNKLYIWYQDNMKTVDDALNVNNSCNYSNVLQLFGEIRQYMIDIINQFESGIVTFKQIKGFADKFYFPVKDEYINGVTHLVLNNNKSCYFNARKVRQNPDRLGDAVIGTITKCFHYIEKRLID